MVSMIPSVPSGFSPLLFYKSSSTAMERLYGYSKTPSLLTLDRRICRDAQVGPRVVTEFYKRKEEVGESVTQM